MLCLKAILTTIKFLFPVAVVLAVFVIKLLNGVYVSFMSIFMGIIKTVFV